MWHQLFFPAHGTWIPRWQGDALLLAVFCCTVSCMCTGEWENWKVLADESTLCLEQSLSRGVIQYRHPSVVPHLENGVSLSPRRIGVCVCVFAALAENVMLTGLALMRLCCDPERVPSSAHDRPASGDQQPPSLTIPRPCNNALT